MALGGFLVMRIPRMFYSWSILDIYTISGDNAFNGLLFFLFISTEVISLPIDPLRVF